MYKYKKAKPTTLIVHETYEGETIEQKVRRVTQNKEPIKDGAQLIYTERKDGVHPDMDIRTDRWEYAVDAMEAKTKSHLAKRGARIGEQAKKNMEKEAKTETKKDGGPEPLQTTTD